MTKNDALKDLKNNVVAVIRIKDTNLARLVTEEIIKNGFKFIELTLSIDNAESLITELKEKYKDVYIGAGTVLSVDDCQRVIKANADFVVSPCMNADIIETCISQDVLCLPGVATPTEIYNCYNLGSTIVKIFPGETLGASFIKNVKGPMPFVECMPSGGVDLDNISDWFANGAYAVSVGSALYSGIKEDNLHEIGERVKAYLNKLPQK